MENTDDDEPAVAAGGCFCEVDGEKSALHMIVSYVDPGKEMRMLGGLGPLAGLALHGAMSWRFEPLGSGGTRIIHTYRVAGYLPDGLDSLAPVVDAVQTNQVARLARALGASDTPRQGQDTSRFLPA